MHKCYWCGQEAGKSKLIIKGTRTEIDCPWCSWG